MLGSLSKSMGGIAGALGAAAKQQGGRGLGAIFKPEAQATGELAKVMEKILQAKPAAEVKVDIAAVLQTPGQAGGPPMGASPEEAYSGAVNAMFIHALAEAADEAAKKPSFNLETAINDLWIKLDRMRPQKEQMRTMKDMMEAISGTIRTQSELARKIAQNLR
jgi:hypothetical protein